MHRLLDNTMYRVSKNYTILDGKEGCMMMISTEPVRRGIIHDKCSIFSTTSLTTLSTVINIAYRSHQDQTSLCWLTNSFLANYGCPYVTTIVKHLYIAWLSLYFFGDFYEFSVKTSENVMQRHRHSAKVVLFEHNSYTVRVNHCATLRGGLTESVWCTVQYKI